MDVDRADVVAVVRLRRFLVAAAARQGANGDPAVAAALTALGTWDRRLRTADYAPAISPDLPLRPGRDWVTVMDAAARLNLTPRAVRYRIGSGRLVAAQDRRGRWLVDPSSLEDSR